MSTESPSPSPQPVPEKKRRTKVYIGSLIVVAVLIFVLVNAQPIAAFLENLFVVLPPSYSYVELVDYALSLINSDRSSFGVGNVSLSSVDSGQRHADNMLRNGFFSHWDISGLKPYMRYTLAGGMGAVSENAAWQYGTGPFDVKEALANLEYLMMYNDSDWNWGHRDNILNPAHNKVSIGISYDAGNVYLVQDFENNYIEWTVLNVTAAGEVTMEGTFTIDQVQVVWINVYYDATPSNLTTTQLANQPYNGTYTPGTFVGMAVPPGYRSPLGVTLTAHRWTQTGRTFQISFDLTPAFNAKGEGVYTLYLQADPSVQRDPFTTYSVWHIN